MKSVDDILNYAALVLEQQDPGGTLPGSLRQAAEAYADLLAACEAALSHWYNDDSQGAGSNEDGVVASQLRQAIARARGELS